ncbi:helix-turn-helix domain-containing protein [Escherichia coli]|nr:helix-turn-helix domain-containing protein [Escherichia coli]EFK1647156.1 helix-turn-helix domain-containing protein [Escherichia coli]EHP9641243.1 helix-turn-helix domain-containing protein [Escherichia coli]EHP9692179.1 helix-turn-helix domain-containing protein [Escherichia coli]EHQ0050968.1 helix-turn-helix domain-containing protein [Escherichia coli]
MRTDNQTHKTLFTIPAAAHSSVPANIKPLPEQRRITGHKQTDAYLWVMQVIRLNDAAHLDAAEAALAKLTITPEEASDRYACYLAANGAHPIQVAFSSVGMSDPLEAIRRARENIKKADNVRAVFGNYESAMEEVEAERIIRSSERFIDDYCWGWTAAEKKAGSIDGNRMNEIDASRREYVNGYSDVLPTPHTLSDIVREFIYWDWLYEMRQTVGRETGDQYGITGEHHESVYDRQFWLEKLLSTIKPVTRNEAVEVCRWFLASGKTEYMKDDGAEVILNLVGECEQ